MIDWLVLAVYALGYFPAAAWVARAAAREGESLYSMRERRQAPRPDMIEAALGCLAALLWPLFAFPLAVRWLASRETAAERRDRLAIERDERVAEMAATIRRLEREAGIASRRP